MQWLFDHTGKRYLDLFSGIVTVGVGHCHPKVNKALKDQVDRLWHTTNIYMHPAIHEYGKKLASKFPGKLKVCSTTAEWLLALQIFPLCACVCVCTCMRISR
jgi:4-aminobutyrate aminotransferase-like enzyme